MNALDLVALDGPVPPAVATKLRRARTALLFRHPFSAAVLLRCRWILTHRVPTAAIDGSHLWINPDFVADLSPAETLGLLHHEALHVAYAHHLRRGERDSKLWNRAGDYVINSEILRLPGAKLPPDGLNDPQYAGWAAERVYAHLVTPPEPESPPEPPSSPPPPPPEPSDEADSEEAPAEDNAPSTQGDSCDDTDSTDETESDGSEEADAADSSDTNPESGTTGRSTEDQDGGTEAAAADSPDPQLAPDTSPTNDAQRSSRPSETSDVQAGCAGAGSASTPEPRPFPDTYYPPESVPDSGFGDVVEPRHADGSPLEPCELETHEKELAIELHQVAQACGTGSPAIARRLAEMRTPRLDVRETLLRYASEISAAHEDLSLTRRNRRYLAVLPDVGMPGPYCETLGHVVAVVDTSGSLDSSAIALFLGTLEEILRAFPALRLTVVAADDTLHEITEIPAGAAELPSPLPLSGYGGTDFRPAIAWAETELDAPPSLLVYLTDGRGPAPAEPPAFPVLWALHQPGWARTPACWGEVAYLDPRG